MATEEEVQYWVDELDDEARLAAQREFTNSIGAEVEELCIRLKEEVAKRYLLICNGDRPKPFGAFDRDEIQRLLAYNLKFTYDGYERARFYQLDIWRTFDNEARQIRSSACERL